MECSTFVEKLQVPVAAEAIKVQSVYRALQRVQERRSKRGQRYEASVVLTLMLLAKLAGEKTVSGIAQWVRLRAAWVQAQLPFKDERLPCANTYQYVCDHVAVDELNQYLGELFVSAPPVVAATNPVGTTAAASVVPTGCGWQEFARDAACDPRQSRRAGGWVVPCDGASHAAAAQEFQQRQGTGSWQAYWLRPYHSWSQPCICSISACCAVIMASAKA